MPTRSTLRPRGGRRCLRSSGRGAGVLREAHRGEPEPRHQAPAARNGTHHPGSVEPPQHQGREQPGALAHAAPRSGWLRQVRRDPCGSTHAEAGGRGSGHCGTDRCGGMEHQWSDSPRLLPASRRQQKLWKTRGPSSTKRSAACDAAEHVEACVRIVRGRNELHLLLHARTPGSASSPRAGHAATAVRRGAHRLCRGPLPAASTWWSSTFQEPAMAAFPALRTSWEPARSEGPQVGSSSGTSSCWQVHRGGPQRTTGHSGEAEQQQAARPQGSASVCHAPGRSRKQSHVPRGAHQQNQRSALRKPCLGRERQNRSAFVAGSGLGRSREHRRPRGFVSRRRRRPSHASPQHRCSGWPRQRRMRVRGTGRRGRGDWGD